MFLLHALTWAAGPTWPGTQIDKPDFVVPPGTGRRLSRSVYQLSLPLGGAGEPTQGACRYRASDSACARAWAERR